MPILRALLIATLAPMLASCIDSDPNVYNRLSLGAFTGANVQILGNLITNTTGISSDTVVGVLMSGESTEPRYADDTLAIRTTEALALFDRGGTAAEIGSVSYGDRTLDFTTTPPPSHYAWLAEEPSPDGISHWRLQWPDGETSAVDDSLPPRFGRISIANGPSLSLAALDQGQAITVNWSGVWQDQRMYMRVQWQQDPGAQQIVSAVKPVYIIKDKGTIALPGAEIATIIPAARGRLSFTLFRGRYSSISSANGGVGVFSWISDGVWVEVTE